MMDREDQVLVVLPECGVMNEGRGDCFVGWFDRSQMVASEKVTKKLTTLEVCSSVRIVVRRTFLWLDGDGVKESMCSSSLDSSSRRVAT